MELSLQEVKMLRQLLNICRSENMDLYIDDILTFKGLRSKCNNFKPKRKEHLKQPITNVHKNGTFSKNEKKIKGKKTKYWHRRNRHKNKQAIKGNNG